MFVHICKIVYISLTERKGGSWRKRHCCCSLLSLEVTAKIVSVVAEMDGITGKKDLTGVEKKQN